MPNATASVSPPSPTSQPPSPSLPPGPRSRLLALWAYLRDPLGCLLPMAARYGRTFTFPGQPTLVCTGTAAGVQAIYGADPDTFEPMNAEMGDLIGHRSLLLLKGAEHRRARKLMSPPFSSARMRAYGDLIAGAADRVTADWQAGRVVSVMDAAQRLSLEVILEAVFGVSEPARKAELAALLLSITNGISPLIALFPSLRRQFGGIGPWASFVRRRARLWALLDALIAERRAATDAGSEPSDILGLLVAARYDDGQPMSDEELRDQLVLLMFAGHETTAIAIAWCIHALHQPDASGALATLRAELSSLPPGATPDELSRLRYLEATCNETLRRYPLAPAPNPRRLIRPLTLDGHALPAGAGVTVAIGLVHFRDDLYPEPLRFRPERFLERTFSPFEFLPFGGGNRRCLGAALAGYEMRIVVGRLLSRFTLELASRRPDPGAVRAANVGPKYGVKARIVERRG